jgi:dienelactone hydrolase
VVFSRGSVCPGAPTDINQDFRQLSGILSQLARWGFVCIAPDLGWLAPADTDNYRAVLRDAGTYMLAENVRPGSLFRFQVQVTGIGIIGHSTSGLAAIFLATSNALPIAAMGLIAPAATSNADKSQITGFAPNPTLVFHGTKDDAGVGVGTAPLDIYSAAGPPKHLVTIDGANHFGYTDSLCLQGDPAATISQADQQKIAKAYLVAFFRRYLQGAMEESNYLSGARRIEDTENLPITVTAQT